jgi:hypothetical protein
MSMHFLDRTLTDLLMTAQDNENDNEPVKLTEEVQSELTEEEPIDADVRVLVPADEERFEQSIDTPKVQEPSPERVKARKSKVRRNSPARDESEGKPISKLQSELRRHSDARKKTDLAVKDIQKQLKDLLLAHHSAIKDLQKQVTQMRRKITTIDSPRKSIRSKTPTKKTARSKKGKNNKSSKKKSRKR